MLSRKQFLVLLGVVGLVFFYYALRPSLIGFDSYHHLGVICSFDAPRNEAPLYHLILPLLPCNILALKALLFLSCFVSIYFLAETGTLFDEKHGWRAGLYAFLSFVFVLEFLKFENDQFAYPFLFAAAYFFFKSLQEGQSKWKNQLIAVLLLLFGAGFWGGTIIFLLPLALIPGTLLLKAASVPVIAFLGRNVWGALFGMSGILEYAPFYGFVWFLFLIPGILGLKDRKGLWLPTIILVVLAAFVPKFGLFLVPFLVVGLTLFVKASPRKRDFFTGLAVMLVVGMVLPIFLQPPFPEMLEASEFAVQQSEDGLVQNEWTLGYLVKYYGGQTKYFSSPDPPFAAEPGIVATRLDLNCKKLREFGDYAVYRC